MAKQNFYNLTFEELKTFLSEKVGIEKGKVKMRAQQLYKAIYQKGLTSFVDLTTVTQDLRKELNNFLSLDLPKIVKTEIADDKTIKWLLELNDENKNLILSEIKKFNIENVDVVSDESIKSKILSNSVFAVSKSGTVSLQISSSKIPSIIIYKLSFINFMIFKMLVNVKFANIINIINNREVIPELLQSECNADEIYRSVIYLLKNPDLIKKQLSDCSKTLEGIRSKTSSSEEACLVLRNYLS